MCDEQYTPSCVQAAITHRAGLGVDPLRTRRRVIVGNAALSQGIGRPGVGGKSAEQKMCPAITRRALPVSAPGQGPGP